MKIHSLRIKRSYFTLGVDTEYSEAWAGPWSVPLQRLGALKQLADSRFIESVLSGATKALMPSNIIFTVFPMKEYSMANMS